MRLAKATVFALAILLPSCASTNPANTGNTATAPSRASSTSAKAEAKEALRALEKGEFDAAEKAVGALLSRDEANPYGRIVRAVLRYKKTMHQMGLDLRTLAFAGSRGGGLNERYLRFALEQAEAELAAVDADLAVAEATPDLALELCLACWEVDWNGNGRLDRFDRLLFQIEQDAADETLPDQDPRRNPTFRFDVGDVTWARAFVAFQRAAMDFVLAYDWKDVAVALEARRKDRPSRIVLRLHDPARMAAARTLLLQGLDLADACRRAYLAETDDDREWVPNPRQRNHPMPLPVDESLYATWEGIVQDVRKLVRGEEFLCMSEIGALIDDDGPRAHGCIDVGRILGEPRDIVVDFDVLKKLERKGDLDGMLSSLLGPHYVRTGKPSTLPSRLDRMHREMARGEESLGRKIRYMLWLN
jgi:hypothetical protein